LTSSVRIWIGGVLVAAALPAGAAAADPAPRARAEAQTLAAIRDAGAVRVTVTARRGAKVRLVVGYGAGGAAGTTIAGPKTIKIGRRGRRTTRVALTTAGRAALDGCEPGQLRVRPLLDRGTQRAPRAGRTSDRQVLPGVSCTRTQRDRVSVPVANPARCDPLDAAVCLQPFPNNHFTVADPGAPTGRRVHLSGASMPANVLGLRIDPREWNRNDGFSPGAPLITRVPGLDDQGALARTRAVPIDDIARAYDRSQAVVVIDTATLARWPVWTELDANPGAARDRNVIVRPARNWLEGHRYVVALRRMRDAQGKLIAAAAPFRALRDGTPTTSGALEERRPQIESLLGTLAQAGIDRDDLYLAWDFTVASRENLSERMLAIRDDAFARLGDRDLSDMRVAGRAPAYTVDKVINDPDGPTGQILRRVEGRVTVPCYLNLPGCLSGSHFNYRRGTARPVANGTMQAQFTCQVPRRALAGVPLRAGIYGHGLLGSRNEVGQAQLKTLSDTEGFTFCATDWVGMACADLPGIPPSADDITTLLQDVAAGRQLKLPNCDVPTVATILLDVSNFPALGDRVQQGMLNFLYLGRAMVHPDGLTRDPAFQLAGKPVLDTSRLYYDGNSQGGIIGGALVAVAPDFDRAVLGVPGMNYSTLLRRSVDFDTYAQILYNAYPSERERPLLLSLMQMLWDRAEANGYAQHMTRDPLPDTPPHEVLLHPGLGDHQVTNYAAKVEARTIGAYAHVPWAAPGRDTDVDPIFGIPAITRYPFAGSAIIGWDIGPLRMESTGGVGTPPAPKTETPPRSGQDPHEFPRRSTAGMRQKSAFLRPGGVVTDVCGGPCYAGSWHGP
jgi:hypothetical protein